MVMTATVGAAVISGGSGNHRVAPYIQYHKPYPCDMCEYCRGKVVYVKDTCPNCGAPREDSHVLSR